MYQKSRGNGERRKVKARGGEAEREEERRTERQKPEDFLVAFWSLELGQPHLFLTPEPLN